MSDTDGRYIVTPLRSLGQWQVQDQSWNPPRDIGPRHHSEADAQAAADRLNHPPRPQQTRQTTLFDPQEA